MGMSSHEQVTRRIQALLDLLKAAASEDDNAILSEEAERCRFDLGELPTELPEVPQDWDTTIEKLTKQLEESLKDTPERDDIEETGPARYKPRATGRKPPRRASPVNDPSNQPEFPKRPEKTEEPPPEERDEPFDHRPQLERELSTMSYPKIGPGYSDSISVVSDLSIPTVMTHWDIPEEEHYGPPIMIGFRQASLGSNQMMAVLPAHESVVAPPTHESSHQVKEPKLRGAAAQRLQHRQAVLAHLRASATEDVQSRRQSAPTQTPTLTVKDFSSLNYPREEPSVYAIRHKRINNGKRNLLRKSNKYATSVTATSTRILLQSNQKKQSNKRYSQQRNKRVTAESPRYNLQRNKMGATEPPVPPPNKVDVDGVLSSINGDINFIFEELSVFDDTLLDNRAKGKIMDNLNSVARSLHTSHKPDSLLKQDALLHNPKDAWASIKSDALLIDEDGFIVSNNTGFHDPFETNKKEDLFALQQVDPFANTFFSASKEDALPKRKVKSRSSKESTTMFTVTSVDSSKDTKINAVEMATKKRIEMLRKLVEDRARAISEDSKQGGSKEELKKLDFVEAETMKQIARLRDRLGESRRRFG